MKRYIKNKKIVPFKNLETSILLSEDANTISEYGYSFDDNSSEEILSLVKNFVENPNEEQINPDFTFFKSGRGSQIDRKWFRRNRAIFK